MTEIIDEPEVIQTPIGSEPLKDRNVSSPTAKFFIGFIAGCAVIIVPRLASMLVSGGLKAESIYFPTNYIIAIIVFASLLGFLVMIMEYKMPRLPKETLFAALAIPGLLAGSLNTALETTNTNQIYKQNQMLSREVIEDNDIPIEELKEHEVIRLDLTQTKLINFENYSFNFSLINSAYAEEQTLEKQKNTYGLSVQRGQPRYVVSIGSFDDKADTIAYVTTYQGDKSNLALIKTSKGFELLADHRALGESEATLEAIKLKRDYQINVKLLKLE